MPGNQSKRPYRKSRQIIRRKLADRDGLERHVTSSGIRIVVRCAVCRTEMALPAATIGHIVPLRDGGSNDLANLRLECLACNQEDSWRRDLPPGQLVPEEMAKRRERFRGKLERRALRKQENWGVGRLYNEVEVLDIHGARISYTSVRRARGLVRAGRIRLVEAGNAGVPRVVQLTIDKPIEDPACKPIENKCVCCGSAGPLRPFRFWPEWHPKGRDLRKTERTAALCSRCYSRIDDLFGAIFDAIAGGPGERPDLKRPDRLIGMMREACIRSENGLEIPPKLENRIRELGGPEVISMDLAAMRKEILARQDARTKLFDSELAKRRQLIVNSGLDLAETFRNLVESFRPFAQVDPQPLAASEGA